MALLFDNDVTLAHDLFAFFKPRFLFVKKKRIWQTFFGPVLHFLTIRDDLLKYRSTKLTSTLIGEI